MNPSILSCFLARLPIALPIGMALNWVWFTAMGLPINWTWVIASNIGVTFLFAMRDAQEGRR